MIKLVEPGEKYLRSYSEAFEEFKERNLSSYGLSDAWEYDIFQKFDDYRNERNLKPDRVGAHYFWLVDDENDHFIGEISIRHRLNEVLERHGGHIGYVVRFSEWNKGYGTLMLKLALTEARKLGLSKILITCNDNNIASARVMEKNGFIFCDRVENTFDGKTFITRRYWKTI